MESTNLVSNLPQEEKAKVAYALNLCAVSISQIIDSKSIVVLKQERENILNNLNLQNFVKHPALFEVIKQILDTITYLEIQAGDLSFIEREYQQKMKNAIWSALPSPGAFFAGGGPYTIVIALAVQVGTGYMNYRRNKNQYALEGERSVWELKRHELEQLYGLRAQLFETAWRLSSDYNFEDKFRLTEKQLSRYSGSLLENDPLKRFERLDVMSEKFEAFPPFWYHKGNAAMEVFRNEKTYGSFVHGYENEAINAYDKFHSCHFEFLREDVIAASCCLEHISLLAPNDAAVEKLLRQALHFAADNYDILEQSILVSMLLQRFDEIIAPLREMVVNNYNVGLNGLILSRIYIMQSNKTEYDKLRLIAGSENVLPWPEGKTEEPQSGGVKLLDQAEASHLAVCKSRLSSEYRSMAKRIVFKLKTVKSSDYLQSLYKDFCAISKSLLGYCDNKIEAEKVFANAFRDSESELVRAIQKTNDETVRNFFESAEKVSEKLLEADFTLQIVDEAPALTEKLRAVAEEGH
jgi:hypothetical protein